MRGEQVVADERVVVHVAVAQLRALGMAGRAGGVEDHRGVVLVALECPEPHGLLGDDRLVGLRCPAPAPGRGRAAALDQEEPGAALGRPEPLPRGLPDRQFRRALEREVRLRVGVGEVTGDLPGPQQHVQRHDSGAGFEGVEVDGGEVREVGAGRCDLVARLDPARNEQVRDAVGGGVEGGVRDAVVTEDDRGALGVRDAVSVSSRDTSRLGPSIVALLVLRVGAVEPGLPSAGRQTGQPSPAEHNITLVRPWIRMRYKSMVRQRWGGTLWRATPRSTSR